MTDLPEMERPPVVEVVCGVHFRALDLDVFRLRPYIDGRRTAYPKQVLKPALVAPAVTLTVQGDDSLPARVWLVAAEDDHLLQVQQDRFYLNWRARERSYPRFHSIHARFREEFEEFASFCEKACGARPQIEKLELAKINLLRETEHWGTSEELAQILPLLAPLEALRKGEMNILDMHFESGDPSGAFVARFQSGSQEADGRMTRVLRFELRAVASPQSADAVAGFGSLNDQIDQAFATLIPRERMIQLFGGSE